MVSDARDEILQTFVTARPSFTNDTKFGCILEQAECFVYYIMV
jgi:hypothetical protein